MNENVVTVEIPVDDWLWQGVQVVETTRDILADPKLLQDVHVDPGGKVHCRG